MFINTLLTYFTILLSTFNFVGSSSNISTSSPVKNVVIGDIVTPGDFSQINGKIVSINGNTPSITDGALSYDGFYLPKFDITSTSYEIKGMIDSDSSDTKNRILDYFTSLGISTPVNQKYLNFVIETDETNKSIINTALSNITTSSVISAIESTGYFQTTLSSGEELIIKGGFVNPFNSLTTPSLIDSYNLNPNLSYIQTSNSGMIDNLLTVQDKSIYGISRGSSYLSISNSTSKKVLYLAGYGMFSDFKNNRVDSSKDLSFIIQGDNISYISNDDSTNIVGETYAFKNGVSMFDTNGITFGYNPISYNGIDFSSVTLKGFIQLRTIDAFNSYLTKGKSGYTLVGLDSSYSLIQFDKQTNSQDILDNEYLINNNLSVFDKETTSGRNYSYSGTTDNTLTILKTSSNPPLIEVNGVSLDSSGITNDNILITDARKIISKHLLNKYKSVNNASKLGVLNTANSFDVFIEYSGDLPNLKIGRIFIVNYDLTNGIAQIYNCKFTGSNFNGITFSLYNNIYISDGFSIDSISTGGSPTTTDISTFESKIANGLLETVKLYQVDISSYNNYPFSSISNSLFDKTSPLTAEEKQGIEFDMNNNSANVIITNQTGTEFLNIGVKGKNKKFLVYPYDFIGTIYKSIGDNSIKLNGDYSSFPSFSDGSMFADSTGNVGVLFKDNTLYYNTGAFITNNPTDGNYKIGIKTSLSKDELKDYKIKLTYQGIVDSKVEEIDLNNLNVDDKGRIILDTTGTNYPWLSRSLLSKDVRKLDVWGNIAFEIINKNTLSTEDSGNFDIYLKDSKTGEINSDEDKTGYVGGGLIYKDMSSTDSYEVFKLSLNELKDSYINNGFIDVCFQSNDKLFITPSSFLNQGMYISSFSDINSELQNIRDNINNKSIFYQKDTGNNSTVQGLHLTHLRIIDGSNYTCYPLFISQVKASKFQDNSLYFSVKRKDITQSTIQNVYVDKYISYSDGYNVYTPPLLENTQKKYSVNFQPNEGSTLTMQYYNPVNENYPLLSVTNDKISVANDITANFMFMKLSYTPKFKQTTSTDRVNNFYTYYGNSNGKEQDNYCGVSNFNGDVSSCVNSQKNNLLSNTSAIPKADNSGTDYYLNNSLPYFASYGSKFGAYISINPLANFSKWQIGYNSSNGANWSREEYTYNYVSNNKSGNWIDSNGGSSIYTNSQGYNAGSDGTAYSPVKSFDVNMKISTPVREWLSKLPDGTIGKRWIYFVSPVLNAGDNSNTYSSTNIEYKPLSQLNDTVQRGTSEYSSLANPDGTVNAEPIIVFNDKFRDRIESVSFEQHQVKDASQVFEKINDAQSLYKGNFDFIIHINLKDLPAGDKYNTNLEFQRLLQEGKEQLFTIHFPIRFAGSFAALMNTNSIIDGFSMESKGSAFDNTSNSNYESRKIDNIIEAVSSLNADALQTYSYSTDVYKYLYTTTNIGYLQGTYKKTNTTTCGMYSCHTSYNISKLSENYVSTVNNYLVDYTNGIPIKYVGVDNGAGKYNSVVSIVGNKVNFYGSFFGTGSKTDDLKNGSDKNKIAGMCSYFSNNKILERVEVSSPYDVWDKLQDTTYNDGKIRVLKYTGSNNLILNSSNDVLKLAGKWILISNTDITISVDIQQVLSNTKIDDNFIVLLAGNEDCSSYKDIYIGSSVVSLQNTVLIGKDIKTTYSNSPLSVQGFVISDSFQCFRNSVTIYRLNSGVKDVLGNSDNTLQENFDGSSNNAQVYGNYKSNGCNIIENPILNTILYKKELLEK